MDAVRGPAPRWPRTMAAASAAVFGLTTVFLLARAEPSGVTHGSATILGTAVSFGAGFGLLTVGLAAALLWPGGGSALTAASLAGLAWLATEWVGWQAGPPLVRSIAMLVEPLFAAAVLHLVLATPTVRLPGSIVRITTLAAYAVAGTVSIVRALVRDPFLDPACWSNCRVNVFLLSSQPQVARVLDTALLYLALAVGGALAVVGAISLVGTTRAGRRTSWPVLAPAAVLGVGLAAHAAVHFGGRLDRPQDPLSSAVFLLRGAAAAALAGGVLWMVLRAWRSRVALARLVADLGSVPAPGTLQLALAAATGDPSLEVIYHPSEGGDPVDARGRPTVVPSSTTRRAVTPIVRDEAEIAAVVHDPAVVGAGELREAIGPAARLAIDNERLQAELLAQLEALQASRARVVEAGDRERRNLERNLHDGAQQRLLALSFDLRLAAREAGSADTAAGAALAAAHASTLEAVTALRELAHGIHPAVLTESGLDAALWTLADAAPIAVELGAMPSHRFPPTIERTAFLVVTDAVAAARTAGRDHVGVAVSEHDGHLVVEVAETDSVIPTHLEDRVGALGGRIGLDGRTLRAELPCA